MKNTAGPLNFININHLESVKAPSEKILGVKTDKNCKKRNGKNCQQKILKGCRWKLDHI